MRGVMLMVLAVMAIQAQGFKSNLDMLKSEGEEGWIEKVIEKGKMHEQQPADEEISRVTRSNEEDKYTSQAVQPFMEGLRKSFYGDFEQTAAEVERPKRWLNKLKEDWDSKDFGTRYVYSLILTAAASNIEKLAKVKEDPIGGVQGVLNIMSSVTQLSGPTGQLASVGFMFASSLFSLFGLGKNKQKSIASVVREQIDDALSKFRDQTIKNKATAAIRKFRISKGFVDGVSFATQGDKVKSNEVDSLVSNVPVISGLDIMGLIATQIEDLKKGNDRNNRAKLFKYIELYLRLSTLKSMIMYQVIGLIPDTHNSIRSGYANAEKVLRQATREMINFLFVITDKKPSIFMPYFDVEDYPITKSYLGRILKIKHINDYPGKDYCIEVIHTPRRSGRHYLGKFLDTSLVPKMTYPLARTYRSKYCKWRIRTHGKDLYSIVSEGRMLSFDNGSPAVVTLERNDPAIWEIKDPIRGYPAIRIKYFCGNKCGYALGTVNYNKLKAKEPTFNFCWHGHRLVKRVVNNVGYLYSAKHPNTHWNIYKLSTPKPSSSDENDQDIEQSGRDIADIDDGTVASGDVTEPVIPENEDALPMDDKVGTNILTSEGRKDWLKDLLKLAKEKYGKKDSKGDEPVEPPNQE